jgi:hypothetical protein
MVHNGVVAGSHRLQLNSAPIHLAKRIKFSGLLSSDLARFASDLTDLAPKMHHRRPEILGWIKSTHRRDTIAP